MGAPLEEWAYGDLEAGFKAAALVLDETFVVQSTGHHPMETRSAMAYWQNGKLFIHASTQSVAQTQGNIARWVGIDPSQVVLICQYTGGGFGSKGGGAVSMAIPALLSRKANAPVMMRISREEEGYIGRARTNMTGRVKVGFAQNGRITALDLFIVQDTGAYGPLGDHRSAGLAASLIYQPPAMRWRAVNVLTNTPPRSQQRSPGPMQANGIIDPVVSKAAPQAWSRSSRNSKDQCAGGQGTVRTRRAERPAEPRHQRVCQRSAGSRGSAVQLERSKGARGPAPGIEGARRWRHYRTARRRLSRMGQHHDHPARRPALRAVGCRQSRHTLRDGSGACRG